MRGPVATSRSPGFAGDGAGSRWVMVEILVVVAGVMLLAVTVAVLVRQRSVGRLSDEDGRPPHRRHVMERPAGPDAEAMVDDTVRREP